MGRIVVVGAGVGGLAAAARLRALRHEVTLCERGERVGGQVGEASHDGLAFDTGPQAMTLPAVFRDLFLKTGPALEECVDLAPVDPACRYVFADGLRLDLPNASRAGVDAGLSRAFGPAASAQWHSVIDQAADMWAVGRGPFVERPWAGTRDLVRQVGGLAGLRRLAPWRSLRSTGRRQLAEPRLRLLLDEFAVRAGADPRRAPAALAVAPYLEQTFGVWRPRGGMRELVAAMRQRCLDLGVRLRLSAEVTQVTRSAGRVDGVVLAGGERLAADAVVAGVDAWRLYSDLAPEPAALSRLKRATPSPSLFTLLLATRGPTQAGQPFRQVWFGPDPDAEFAAVFGPNARPAADPTITLFAPDDERHTLVLRTPAARHGTAGAAGTVDWDEPGLSERYAARLLDLLAARGLDLRGQLLWSRTRTPADLARSVGANGGAAYGVAPSSPWAALRRPANRSPAPGLFLVGASAHPGGGLALVGMSAAIVAELIGRA